MSASPSQHIPFLAALDLFRALDEAALRDVAVCLRPATFKTGEQISRQGVVPEAAYIVVQGALAATAALPQGERLLAMLGPGESVGGWQILTGAPACADITVTQDALLLRLDRSDLTAFLQSHEDAAAGVTATLGQQERRWRLLIALHVKRIFGDLDELALRDLATELELITLRGGNQLYRYGDVGDAMHVIVSGRLRVQAPAANGEVRTISELGTGETVGEMALVSGEPRTASVYAVRDTQLARLTRSRFERFVARHPQCAMQMVASTLVARLKQQTAGERRREQPRIIALIPATLDVPLAEFTTRLSQTLAQYGTTQELSSATVDRALAAPGISQARGGHHDLRLVEWLGNQEAQHDYLLYHADSSPTDWTRRCLRQADHVVIVAQANASTSAGEIERFLQQPNGTGSPRSLVLLQEESAPVGTARWLDGRTLEGHYHVRLHSQPDFDRLARFLLRRALGLTLGGGFARGLVHVGVIRALREAGIAIDAIGGNSMGALIAAQWAQGWDEERILRETVAGCAACIRGIGLPVVAFKSGARFSRLVTSFFGDTQIEDLPVPYFCVSANLNRAELQVHRRGSLSKAVLASTRVPGVFPPIVYDGELHVDGGVIDNVPVDIMRSVVKSGTVIGVDAIPSREFNLVTDYGTSLSGWRALWARISPFSKTPRWIPNILLIMLRTIEFGGITHNRSAASTADLYLRPPLHQFKATDFTMAAQIVEIGYRHARAELERWLSARQPAMPA